MDNKNLYSKLGVSSKKEEIHEVIKTIDKGLYPGAFCKIVKDIANRNGYCSIIHADGAGTKSGLAYMYYRETGDISVFKGIVQDAIVMNIDDVLCVGGTGNIFLSNSIGRNSKLISGKIISEILKAYDDFCIFLTSQGLNTISSGGETADIGDLVKTIVVDATIFTSMKREDVINANNIQKEDVIIGLASFGKASYEDEYNSGIGSNGLTLARHGTLSHEYYTKYPECYDQNLDEKLIFFGRYRLTEQTNNMDLTIGKALLSPTRTYVPVVLEILKQHRKDIHGIIHNTGGGQTKILNFGNNIKYVKNNIFRVPIIFEIIQESSNTQWKEMYQVFNMGHRMELLCEESIAKDIIKIVKKYNIDAKIIGQCEKSPIKNKNTLEVDCSHGIFNYI